MYLSEHIEDVSRVAETDGMHHICHSTKPYQPLKPSQFPNQLLPKGLKSKLSFCHFFSIKFWGFLFPKLDRLTSSISSGVAIHRVWCWLCFWVELELKDLEFYVNFAFGLNWNWTETGRFGVATKFNFLTRLYSIPCKFSFSYVFIFSSFLKIPFFSICFFNLDSI